MKGAEAPNIEIEVEDCEEYTTTFSFYVVSGSNLSQVHMVVENLGATEASQLKEDVTAYERQRHLRRRCVGHDRSPKFRPPHNDERRHLRWKVCGPRYEPSSERLRANVMARYKWTGV